MKYLTGAAVLALTDGLSPGNTTSALAIAAAASMAEAIFSISSPPVPSRFGNAYSCSLGPL